MPLFWLNQPLVSRPCAGVKMNCVSTLAHQHLGNEPNNAGQNHVGMPTFGRSCIGIEPNMPNAKSYIPTMAMLLGDCKRKGRGQCELNSCSGDFGTGAWPAPSYTLTEARRHIVLIDCWPSRCVWKSTHVVDVFNDERVHNYFTQILVVNVGDTDGNGCTFCKSQLWNYTKTATVVKIEDC